MFLNNSYIPDGYFHHFCNNKVRNNKSLLKTATVSRTPTGKYYISIIVENDIEYPEKQEFSHATMIGVDVGNITFASLST